MRIARAVGIGLLGWTVLLGASPGAAALAQAGDDHAAAARIFAERVERYARLRARLEEPLPPFDARRDAWSLLLTRRYLASAIRSARAHATPGNLFAPPVDGLFREAIGQAIYEVDIEGLVAGWEDPVDLVINEPVPDWALHAVPDALLARLPPLPEAISYRLAGGALVVWDEHAEIVIDALPDAFITR
ncbi:MAG: hypothetical protein HYU37_20220 [Acidobacteria bacterium]|nr:hypothetical protein [Acidobacteriota bacterium]